MNNNVKAIDLIFENCEVINIERKYIGDFFIHNVITNYERCAVNNIRGMKIATSIRMELKRNLNDTEYHPFDIDGKQVKVFDRISRGDITAVELIFEDDSSETIYADWGGDSEYINENQSSFVSEKGHMYLVISKDKDAVMEYPLEEVNDREDWWLELME